MKTRKSKAGYQIGKRTRLELKRIGALLTVMLFMGGAALSAQEADSASSNEPDTTRITWGKKKIIIIDGETESKVEDTVKAAKKKEQRWNHFSGIDLGINGFLTNDNSIDLGKEEAFMDLNYRKSIFVAINIWERYIPIAKEKFGITTGLGFEFNKYALDRNYDLLSTKDSTFGVVASPTKDIDKNLFKTIMLNVPLMLETNIGKDAEHSFHLQAGAMLGYRLDSKTEQDYEENDKTRKVKDRNDYNLNDFRLNAVVRLGYGDFTVFASYSLTELFEDNKGPELYPFTVGISLVSF